MDFLKSKDVSFAVQIPSKESFESARSASRNVGDIISTTENITLKAKIINKNNDALQEKEFSVFYSQVINVSFDAVPVTSSQIAVQIDIY